MIVHEINFYREFNCLMGDCPNTCCKNWVILVDKETYGNYLNEPGLKGIKLRRGIERHGEDVVIKKKKGVCPFLSKEGKCSNQISDGDRFMPEVCRVFPRTRTNYQFFSEEALFLSCPEAARLFYENIYNLCFVETEKSVDYESWVTNEDKGFLDELVEIRKELAEFVMNKEIDRSLVYGGLIEYCRDVQICYAENTKRADLDQYINDLKEFYISSDYIDKIITSGLYHKQLKKTGPLLYELFNEYFKYFDKLTAEQANEFFYKIRTKMHAANSEIDAVLRAYLKYYLYVEFLYAYEDYSMLKCIILGIAHTTILELLLSLYYKKYGHIEKEDIIKVISSYDRRGRHNDAASNNIYKALEKLILSMCQAK